MAKKDRTYKVVQAVTGGPPTTQPVLGNANGQVLPANELLVFNKNTDQMKKVDHYRIRFEIEDFNNSRLRFVPNEGDVMWVQEGEVCPASFCELPGVIWVDKVDNQGRWIDVINMDMQQLRFQFTLNLVDKNIANPTLADYVPLDPGGGNQNGGLSGSDFTSALDIVDSGIIGAFAGLVTLSAAGAAATLPAITTSVLVGGLTGLVAMLILKALRGWRPQP